MKSQEEFTKFIVSFLTKHAVAEEKIKEMKIIEEETDKLASEMTNLFDNLVSANNLGDLRKIVAGFSAKTILAANDSFNIRQQWRRLISHKQKDWEAEYVRDKFLSMISKGRRRGVL